MKRDYSLVERKAIESVIEELEAKRKEYGDEIVKNQQANCSELVCWNRGAYFLTGVTIEKLREQLQIPFEDLVEGVRLGLFDANEVVIQLKLKKQMTIFHEEDAYPLAEMLVAAWRGEPLETESYQKFEDLRQKLIRGEDDEWGLYLAYRIERDLSKKIIESWKELAVAS